MPHTHTPNVYSAGFITLGDLYGQIIILSDIILKYTLSVRNVLRFARCAHATRRKETNFFCLFFFGRKNARGNMYVYFMKYVLHSCIVTLIIILNVLQREEKKRLFH